MNFFKERSLHFWIEGQVVSIDMLDLNLHEFHEDSKFNGELCIDTEFLGEEDAEEYLTGTFTLIRRSDGRTIWHWVSVPIKDLPSEFKLQLILLGVTI